MQITSAYTALSLLRGGDSQISHAIQPSQAADRQPVASAVPSRLPQKVADTENLYDDGCIYLQDPSLYSAAEWAEFRRNDLSVEQIRREGDIIYRATEGKVGPFDPELIEASGHKKLFDRFNMDPRKQFIGVFYGMSGPPTGEAVEQKDAVLPDRHSAMATAYFWGSFLASSLQRAAVCVRELTPEQKNPDGTVIGIHKGASVLAEHDHLLESIEADTTEALMSLRNVERAAANLAQFFSYDNTLATHAAYAGKTVGFTVSHGDHGKLMEFGADGSLTLFDGEGKAWTPRDYDRAAVDGGIPQLHNEIVDQDDWAELTRPI